MSFSWHVTALCKRHPSYAPSEDGPGGIGKVSGQPCMECLALYAFFRDLQAAEVRFQKRRNLR